MRTWYRVAAAAIGWFVIGLQYYLTVGKADGDFVLAGRGCCPSVRSSPISSWRSP